MVERLIVEKSCSIHWKAFCYSYKDVSFITRYLIDEHSRPLLVWKKVHYPLSPNPHQSNVLLSLLVVANWSEVLCACASWFWASGAGMGWLVSHWGSAGCWAGLGWAEMKGRWRIARKMKMGHSMCAPYDYYQWIAINGKWCICKNTLYHHI